jgi:hypothetical protein
MAEGDGGRGQNFGDAALRVFLSGSFYSVDMLPPF